MTCFWLLLDGGSIPPISTKKNRLALGQAIFVIR